MISNLNLNTIWSISEFSSRVEREEIYFCLLLFTSGVNIDIL